jgi:hypothetical protein
MLHEEKVHDLPQFSTILLGLLNLKLSIRFHDIFQKVLNTFTVDFKGLFVVGFTCELHACIFFLALFAIIAARFRILTGKSMCGYDPEKLILNY